MNSATYQWWHRDSIVLVERHDRDDGWSKLPTLAVVAVVVVAVLVVVGSGVYCVTVRDENDDSVHSLILHHQECGGGVGWCYHGW